MSKFVKDLIAKDIRSRLEGVEDALLVDITGVTANSNCEIRRELRAKNMNLLVINNSQALRATEGTSLAPAFEGLLGPAAVVWGGEDVVSLAKEVVRISKEKQYQPFHARGGVMDGVKLSREEVEQVSKWPSRQEQLSMLVGQMLAPGANLSAALLGPFRMLASQIKKKSEGEDGEGSPEDAASDAASDTAEE